ncbi:hypothetical protein H5410_024029 [Solanum commersonii]|uniref:DUF7870 domain-containing protein n=1 Tax=Solanum commersonii TaxID=4109 RepID=A0A9J5ZKU3_SOLCO|nr:hypothetical protein H5410_024029 [Solanum commersonii]
MANYNSIKLEVLPLIFHDLANEGLLKTRDRSLFITNGNEEVIYNSQVTSDYNMDLISLSDLAHKDETYDFALIPYDSSKSLDFIDRAMNVGGIVVVQLINNNPMITFSQPSNYKVVYIRKFDSTILAMRKTSSFTSIESTTTQHHRKLFNFGPNAKEDALKKLEDVLLEPPRAASGKSSRYLKKTRYLPELMNIHLESYPRRNTKFEIFKIEIVAKESSAPLIGMSDWLEKNVKENEYVVMKAEAEVVEEMSSLFAAEERRRQATVPDFSSNCSIHIRILISELYSVCSLDYFALLSLSAGGVTRWGGGSVEDHSCLHLVDSVERKEW